MINTNIIISKPAFNGAAFKEAVDLGLVCAAFDQNVKLIFIDDGIYNLIKDQSAKSLNDKNYVDILKGLEFYDIENIYFECESLASTRLQQSNLISQALPINRIELNQLNMNANHLLHI